jgi:2-oxoisovalerate dehydrogenase E2 component (dihydrolipoyl transacylase)
VVRDFNVPDLGEGLEDVTVVQWFVAVGDVVALNQPLGEVETAKAVVEIPSPFAGVIVERGGEPGTTLLVGSLLVRIDTGGADGPKASEPPAQVEAGGRTPVLVGYGADQSHDHSRRRNVVDEGKPPSSRPLAKPPVRMLARTLGLNLSDLAPGTGAGGIVTRADVLAAGKVDARGAVGGGAREDGARGTSGDDVARPAGLSAVRARMAERMTLSRSRIPDATCSVVVDCSRLLAARNRLNEAMTRAGSEPIITPFALICRFVVDALRANPLLNATFVDEGPAIQFHEAVHLGLAAATERGLLVPVVHDAHTLTTLELAAEAAQLFADARANKLTPRQLQGSTFTISNFGSLGLDEGIPVINYPEAAILGVGAIRPRAVVVDEAIVARPTATFTCAFDHRVCDGAEAAAFLVHVRRLTEDPDLFLVSA